GCRRRRLGGPMPGWGCGGRPGPGGPSCRRSWLGRAGAGASRRVEIRPYRREEAPPLLGCVGDRLLHGRGDRGGGRGDTGPPITFLGGLDALQPAEIPPAARSTDGGNVDRSTGFNRE